MPRVLVTNALDASLAFYDATTRKPLKNLKVGKAPHGIAVGRNRKFGFVTNTGEDSISIVDVVRMTEENRVSPPGLKEPAGVAALADGRRLIVTSKTREEVYLVDSQRESPAAVVPLGGPACQQIASMQGGERIVLGVKDGNRLVELDPRSQSITREHDLPGPPSGLCCARDQRNLLVAVTDPAMLVVVEGSTGNILNQIETAPGPSMVKAHPYRNAAYVLTAGGVQSVDLDEGTVQPPIPSGARPVAFDVARAGKMLYVISSEGNNLAVVEAGNRNIRHTWETGHHPTCVVFVP